MQRPISCILLLLCLLTVAQRVRRRCPPAEECRPRDQCHQFVQLYNVLKKLSRGSAEYEYILKSLKEKVCDSATKKVCCNPVSREISGAIGPADPNEFPFMVRLTVRGAEGVRAHCGASLIAPKFLATAWHCFYNSDPDINFDRDCSEPGSCYASIGEHDISRTDSGEQDIDIKAVFRPPSTNEDLAIVELNVAVLLNMRVQLVKVSNERLEPGAVVTTLGWGLAFQRGQPNELLKARLNVSEVDLEGSLTYTEVGSDRFGIPVDTCQGDSGGPLLAWRDDHWQVFATLQGGGYNCVTDRTRGDGVWNSLAANYEWVSDLILSEADKNDQLNTSSNLVQVPGLLLSGDWGSSDPDLELQTFPPQTCNIPDFPPEGRHWHSLSLLPGSPPSALACGGSHTRRSCIIWTKGQREWLQHHTTRQARVGHCAALLGETLLLLGGEGSQSEGTAETVPGGQTFSLRNPGDLSCSLVKEGEVIMIAGYGEQATEGLAHVDRYNLEGYLGSLPDLRTARYGPACASFTASDGGTVLLVTGGRSYTKGRGTANLDSTELLLPGAEGWQEARALPRAVYGPRAATLPQGGLLVTGGYDGDTDRDEVWQYFLDENSWKQVGRMERGYSFHVASPGDLAALC